MSSPRRGSGASAKRKAPMPKGPPAARPRRGGGALMIKGPVGGSHVTIMYSKDWSTVDAAKAEQALASFVGKTYKITDPGRKTPTGKSVYFRSTELLAFRNRMKDLGAAICLRNEGGDVKSFHSETSMGPDEDDGWAADVVIELHGRKPWA